MFSQFISFQFRRTDCSSCARFGQFWLQKRRSSTLDVCRVELQQSQLLLSIFPTDSGLLPSPHSKSQCLLSLAWCCCLKVRYSNFRPRGCHMLQEEGTDRLRSIQIFFSHFPLVGSPFTQNKRNVHFNGNKIGLHKIHGRRSLECDAHL